MKALQLSLLSVLCFGTSCSSTPSAADLEPASLRIALLPIDAAKYIPREGACEADIFEAGFTKRLRELRAGVQITAVRDAASLEAQKADLVIRPILEGAAAPNAIGRSDMWLQSSALWLLTWAGGMFVPDYSYDYGPDFELRCLLMTPTGTEYAEHRVPQEAVNMSFFERNSIVSTSTLQALVLPPAFTTDSASLHDALAQAMYERGAESLARYLKTNFEDEAAKSDAGSIVVVARDASAGQAAYEVTVRTRKPATRLTVLIDDEVDEACEIDRKVDDDKNNSGPSDISIATWNIKIPANAKTMTLRCVAEVRFSRTFKLR